MAKNFLLIPKRPVKEYWMAYDSFLPIESLCGSSYTLKSTHVEGVMGGNAQQ